MNDYTLCCNISKCKVPLNDAAWVTRCMHVFCSGHGQAYFANQCPQIHCPVCNELNLKDVDILQCEINPSDMVLAGISPEKATALASKSLKLWWSQIQEDHSSFNSKSVYYEKKNQDLKYNYHKLLNKTKQKYAEELNVLKMHRFNLIQKVQELNNELTITKANLKKYKAALATNRTRNLDSSSLSPHWFSNDDNVLLDRPSPSSGLEFSFNGNIFN